MWHDQGCKQLQQQIRAINQHTADEAALAKLQQLQCAYQNRVRKLVRKHKATVGRERLAMWRTDKRSFWRSYKPRASRSPFSPAFVAQHFCTKMNSYQAPPDRQRQAIRPQDIDVTSSCPSVPAIIAAIKAMDSHAAGTDGIPTALFKPWVASLPRQRGAEGGIASVQASQPSVAAAPNAVAHIAAGLHLVYERISQSATVPSGWRSALLAPIHKGKGDLADISNYRPLSMPSVACRVWSCIINKKLMQAAGEKNILPDVMYGFLPGKSCSDPLFIVRHLADMHKAGKGQIFAVAFMDLSGAYDSVCRELMFEKLQKQVGLSDHSLATLRGLYDGTQCIVKCEGGLSEPFEVRCGVRQGCPLSTTLFNLFIHDLHTYLGEHCAGMGVKLRRKVEDDVVQQRLRGQPQRHAATPHPVHVSDLSYADDINLCAGSPQHLQTLLDRFATYCKEHGLIINPSKCETMVFSGGGAWPHDSWSVEELSGVRRPLARVVKFKYLGVELHGGSSILAVRDHRYTRMVAAQSTIYKRLSELHTGNDPQLIADLFDSVTAAAGSYGCEIWCTPLLSGWQAITACPLHRYQTLVYKRALGVPNNTSNLLTLFEMGRYPLQIAWLSRVVRYWNKRVAEVAWEAQKHRNDGDDAEQQVRPDQTGSLLTQAFCANVHYGLDQNRNCWSKELCAGLQFVMPEVDWRSHMLDLRPIDPRQIVKHAKHAFCKTIQQFTADPTADGTKERQRCKYASWMLLGGVVAPHTELPVPAYLSADAPLIKKRALASIRLSNAPIRTAQLHEPAYNLRHCNRCRTAQADSEQHWLYDCAALAGVRQKHAAVVARYTSVRDLMTAVYDSSSVDEVLDFVMDATKVANKYDMDGQRQGITRQAGRPVRHQGGTR